MYKILHFTFPFLLALSLLMCGKVAAAGKVALVIGNSDYQHVPELPNPKNDAADVASKLRQIGFHVIDGRDLTLVELRGTVRRFIDALSDAELGLFYYAGHGLQVNGRNYLAPVDARLETYDDLDFEAFPVETILAAMERKTKTNLVFLDACRNNPLARNLARSMGTRSTDVGRGLARISTGIGTLISFSTQPGNVALDGAGRNSPFTSALVKHLGTPGEDITRSLRRVRNDVLELTSGKQVPWENSSLTGDVILVEPAIPAASDRQKTSGSDEGSSAEVEIAYWNSIKDADSTAFFQSYLANYPSGRFADIAKLKMQEIDKRRQAAASATKTQTTSQDAPTAGAADSADGETKVSALTSATGQPAENTGSAPADVGRNNEQQADPEKDQVLVRSIQNELNRLGCSAGAADGVWGDNTERGLRNYARNAGQRIASLNPSEEMLERLKNSRERICPAGLLANLNGRWVVERIATGSSCGWKRQKSNLNIRNGVIGDGTHWKGSVDEQGRVSIKTYFIHQQRKQSNSLSGTMNVESGGGTFRHDQGRCRGRFTLTRS